MIAPTRPLPIQQPGPAPVPTTAIETVASLLVGIIEAEDSRLAAEGTQKAHGEDGGGTGRGPFNK